MPTSGNALHMVTGEPKSEPSGLELVVSQPGETRLRTPSSLGVDCRRRLASLVLVQTSSIFVDASFVVDSRGVGGSGGGRPRSPSAGICTL